MMSTLIERPDPVLLAKLNAVDPRLKYHATAESFQFRENVYTLEEALTDPSTRDHLAIPMAYRLYVFDQLVPRIKKEYADSFPVALRGIVLNLGPTFSLDASPVKNALEVLRDGTERNNLQVLHTLLTSEDTEIHYRTRQWTVQSTQQLRACVADKQHSLFPAIIVYDCQKFPTGVVPASLDERSRIILGMYVLDHLNYEAR